MTFAEVLDVGRECLAEYEPRLKVLGRKPWDASANGSLCQKYVGFSGSTTSDHMKQSISGVLEGLAALSDSFVMSGPRDTIETTGRIQSISHDDLSLSFACGYVPDDNTTVLWINCWYYPAT